MSAASLPTRVKHAVQNRVASRYRLRGEIDAIDAVDDPVGISALLATREFPWGITQALSFALFRTYAVPSIGELLYDTQQFTKQTQKRYDDTVLLLDAPIEHGFDSAAGRAGVRRINQMHAMYDISNDDMLYVLSTFVVCPVQWVNSYEWRKLTGHEVTGLTNHYRMLGKRMAIKDIPATYEEFEQYYEDYERRHFEFSTKSLAVADSTLDLLGTFLPYRLLPRWVVRRMSFALMDDRLLTAFHYPKPSVAERVLVRGGLKLRGLAIRLVARPRTQPLYGRQTKQVRGYPRGYRLEELGTFTPGCPVPHHRDNPADSNQDSADSTA
ncbi:oxygenase MpaB family protein [Gordonia sp. SL306]|uniref:oxygenase MpaB family protein n=1 Tax=Gordonia sp. SL306 TaxID=2995145 RepID=UPI0022707FAB|nr:oxygenase MpaB family protein [Gordonia sp. SL306]WAC56731.1 oxygenase MpaB family protein [Gordonia sp. SL306]